MVSLPKYPDIKETDRAYFAGLFDGEGTVYISKTFNKECIGYSLTVSFDVTYKNILTKLYKLFGGRIYIKDMEKVNNYKSVKESSPDKLKQLYRYALSGVNALYFLKIIEPFCDEKKQQVQLAIRYEQGKRNKNYRSKEETDRCEFFHRELKRLKKEQLNEDKNEYEPDFEDQQMNIFSFVKEE